MESEMEVEARMEDGICFTWKWTRPYKNSETWTGGMEMEKRDVTKRLVLKWWELKVYSICSFHSCSNQIYFSFHWIETLLCITFCSLSTRLSFYLPNIISLGWQVIQYLLIWLLPLKGSDQEILADLELTSSIRTSFGASGGSWTINRMFISSSP